MKTCFQGLRTTSVSPLGGGSVAAVQGHGSNVDTVNVYHHKACNEKRWGMKCTISWGHGIWLWLWPTIWFEFVQKGEIKPDSMANQKRGGLLSNSWDVRSKKKHRRRLTLLQPQKRTPPHNWSLKSCLGGRSYPCDRPPGQNRQEKLGHSWAAGSTFKHNPVHVQPQPKIHVCCVFFLVRSYFK